MFKPVRIFTLLVVCLFATGCSGLNHRQSVMAPERESYQAAVTAWTKESRIYHGLDTKLIAQATFKSLAFRRAYAAEYARVYRLSRQDTDKLVLDQERAAADYHDVVIAAYVPQKNWDDFSQHKSMWRIYITRDGIEQIEPLEIRKLKKKDPKLAYFYPYTTTWNSIYQARFPTTDPETGQVLLDDPAGSLTLVMTSVIGSVEFQWDPINKP